MNRSECAEIRAESKMAEQWVEDQFKHLPIPSSVLRSLANQERLLETVERAMGSLRDVVRAPTFDQQIYEGSRDRARALLSEWEASEIGEQR